MQYVVVILAILLILLLPTAFLLGRHLPRRRMMDELSPVSRQHIELFQGGQLNEAAVESAKSRFRALLEQGEVEAVEASLRPGMHFVVHVRALAEIGTDDAGNILERQLQRRLTDDQLEQSWYWIDLANGLRSLNREQSLPHLLRCAESAGESPLGHFFAAETACFLGFAGYLRHDTGLGRSALRVLHRTLQGLRHGVPPQVVAEARLGETIERLWDHRPENVSPLVVLVFAEALRLVRRAPHADIAFSEEASELEAFHWQVSRLAALEPALQDYLDEAPQYLRASLKETDDHRDHLLALQELRADAYPEVLPLIEQPRYQHRELALEALSWSREPEVGRWLRDYAVRQIDIVKRAQKRRRAMPPLRRTIPADMPYHSLLRALRGHGSRETESFLLLAARDFDPTYRSAAISSLGWWEPVHRCEVQLTLQEARHDPSPEVRQASRAALARLGECQSLQWFRQALHSEDPHHVFEAMLVVATEGLTLLWPDLDELADSEDSDVAFHAREALERMNEDLLRHSK